MTIMTLFQEEAGTTKEDLAVTEGLRFAYTMDNNKSNLNTTG